MTTAMPSTSMNPCNEVVKAETDPNILLAALISEACFGIAPFLAMFLTSIFCRRWFINVNVLTIILSFTEATAFSTYVLHRWLNSYNIFIISSVVTFAFFVMTACILFNQIKLRIVMSYVVLYGYAILCVILAILRVYVANELKGPLFIDMIQKGGTSIGLIIGTIFAITDYVSKFGSWTVAFTKYMNLARGPTRIQASYYRLPNVVALKITIDYQGKAYEEVMTMELKKKCMRQIQDSNEFINNNQHLLEACGNILDQKRIDEFLDSEAQNKDSCRRAFLTNISIVCAKIGAAYCNLKLDKYIEIIGEIKQEYLPPRLQCILLQKNQGKFKKISYNSVSLISSHHVLENGVNNIAKIFAKFEQKIRNISIENDQMLIESLQESIDDVEGDDLGTRYTSIIIDIGANNLPNNAITMQQINQIKEWGRISSLENPFTRTSPNWNHLNYEHGFNVASGIKFSNGEKLVGNTINVNLYQYQTVTNLINIAKSAQNMRTKVQYSIEKNETVTSTVIFIVKAIRAVQVKHHFPGHQTKHIVEKLNKLKL